MADRIIVMNEGEMLLFATPGEIFERPASEFVATFVGEPQMNVMDATLRRSEAGLSADCGAFSVPLPQDWAAANQLMQREGSRVRLGVKAGTRDAVRKR